MKLLQKTQSYGDDRRADNADKKPLLDKANHPRTAKYYQQQWSFIADEALRENISYQLQYVEFLITLYNEYHLYLTIESYLCKDILIAVAAVAEGALFDAIATAKKSAGVRIERQDFVGLLGEAYHGFGIIDKDTWHYFHELRKVRNYTHLAAADFQEHMGYSVKEANEAINRLQVLRISLSGHV